MRMYGRKKKRTPVGKPEIPSLQANLTLTSKPLYKKRPLTVYLAGKMTGLSPSESKAWRVFATAKLEAAGFYVLDPSTTDISESKPRLIYESNNMMIENSDIILVELIYPKEMFSIGTFGEIIVSAKIGKPVICFTKFDEQDEELSADYIDHPWITSSVTTFASSLNNAIDIIIKSF